MIKVTGKGIVVFCALVFVLALNNCTWDKSPYNNPNGVCYQTQIEPIINSNCAKSGCHDGTGEEAPALTSYNDVMKFVKPGRPGNSKLVEVITGHGEDLMPPAPNQPLTQDQINLIQLWILEGAGNDPNCAFSIPCDTSNVTFSATVFPIIQSNCLGCHSSPGGGGGILLTTHSEIVSNIDRVWGAINHNSGFQPMPQGVSQLSDCNIAMIGKWISDGAPNN